MELHTLDRKTPMAHTHNDARAIPFASTSADGKVGRQIFFSHDQRVVTGGGHGRRDTAEDRLPVMLNTAGLAMHQVPGPHDSAAKGCPNGLMSKTNTEQRDLACEMTYEVDADAGFLRSAGTWRDHDVIWMQAF